METKRFRPPIVLTCAITDIAVPGHGHLGGPELIIGYREYLEYARPRVAELREAGEPESRIVDLVGSELLDLHPDWGNRERARGAAADLRWPGRS